MGGSKTERNIKEDFLRLLSGKITVWFNMEQFIHDNSVVVREGEVTLEQVGNYYCPWYYNAETEEEISNKGIEETLSNPQARAVAIKDVMTKCPSKAAQMEGLKKSLTEKSLDPFPIATDIKFNKSLGLDGNKTLVALYQSWAKNKKVRVTEIYGENLIRILPDFCILYKG